MGASRPPLPCRSRHRLGFTLLEVLAVVGIIVILLGLLFPAAAMLRQSAKRRLAMAQSRAIIHAVLEYRSVYGQWPGQTQGLVDGVYTNCATIVSDLTDNARQIDFLEAIDGIQTNGFFMDPWQRPYVVGIDENGDGITEMPSPVSGSSTRTSIVDSVAVFSLGPAPSDASRHIYSWRL